MKIVETFAFLISLHIAATVAGGPPVPGSLDAAKASVRKGDDVVLGCEVSRFAQDGQLPPYVIQWFHDDVPVYIKVGKHPPHVNNAFEDRLSIAGDEGSNASLKIQNVTLLDEGWYQCQILFLRDTFEKSTNGTWIKLEVRDPPSFIEKPPPIKIARQGQSLLLKCRATGHPQPVITWRRDEELLRDGQDGILLSRGDLAVTSLTASHRGKYTCLAQSVEGQTRATINVKVEAPPEFDKTPSDLTVQEGSDAMFNCVATGYPTSMTYRWTYNGDPVNLSQQIRGRFRDLSDGTLIIYNINTKDRGNVSCTVDNGFGTTKPATAELHVQFRARVLNMPAIAYAGFGLKATLRCPTEAHPPVNRVVWKKRSERILFHQNSRVALDRHGSLIITLANYGDSGRYTCTPYNIHGTLGESTATELRIREPPYFTLKPKPSYEAEIGKNIDIPCIGGGDPPPAVAWRKVLQNGDSVPYKVELGNLTITHVTKAIHGTWQCVLTNSVATVAENVEIYVKYTRPHKVLNVSALPLSDSAVRVSWTPGYNGGYRQNFIVWYRQAGKIDPSWQTYDVGGSHTVAVLEGLLPNTEYEVAVLPENKMRSGPFSETVTTATRVTRPPINSRAPLVPPPQALFPSTTDAGLVQLSWRKPNLYRPGDGISRARLDIAPTDTQQKIMGFLLEYRWTEVAPEENQEKISTRLKRSTKIAEKGEWDILTTTYENVTAVVVQPKLLYRDLMYEFRVLTVSENEYSPPSNPVSFSTKGLTAYPCYTGPLSSAATIGHPVIAGILAAVILILVFVGFSVFWCCRRRKRRKKGDVVTLRRIHEDSTAGRAAPAMNGKVIVNMQPIVVDLTGKGSCGYGTMEKMGYDTAGSDDEANTSFIRNNNNVEESDKIFTAFIQSHSGNLTNASRSPSDRSSVRLRRETTAKVLLEQYKRRSFTDQTYHKIHRAMPLRGGTRSASTSPERSHAFARRDNLNMTDPTVLEDPTGRKRIRLYSRPIDDAGSAQQRRMIVIKRKSHKSSSSEPRKKTSTGATPSDSSESPVFGVVGTIKHSSTDSLDNVVTKTSSPIKTGNKSTPYREQRQVYRTPPFEGDVFHRRHGFDSKNDDFIFRSPGNDTTSPLSDPISTSSPNDNSSPDVSPNRVIARSTVEYDHKMVPVISPRQYAGSPSRRQQHWAKANSISHEQRAALQPFRSEKHWNPYPHTPYPNLTHSDPYDRGRTPHYYPNPGYQMLVQGQKRGRYSYAQHPQGSPVTSYETGYHSQLAHNTSRSRASYSVGHRQPLALYSPNKVYDHPHSVQHLRPSTSVSKPKLPSSSDRRPPTSTCEIDCSNSDIEVRFVKNADGNGYSPVLTYNNSGRGGMVSVFSSGQSPSTVTALNAESVATPSSGNSALDLRHNLQNVSISDARMQRAARQVSQHPSSPTKIFSTQPLAEATNSTNIEQSQTEENPRPRYLISPPGSKTSSPLRRMRLKYDDGKDCPPTSPPLATIGSSDYGSQDTSNSSISPLTSNTNGQGAISPTHLRLTGVSQERPPRRDNSSVEDNYEWDSEIAMESEILEAVRLYRTLKKSGPVSDELLDELYKIIKDTKNMPVRQRARSADILDSHSSCDDVTEEELRVLRALLGPNYYHESMTRRCAALRAEFLDYRQLHQLEEDGVT